MNRGIYQNPLNTRYASKEMSRLFSEEKKFRTFRRLWIALAKGERELGLNITEEQIAAMERAADDIDFERAAAIEKEVRHDVMAHVKTYGEAAPEAKGIIHLGATSCFVGDNTDLIVMREALELLEGKLLVLLSRLRDFALEYKDLPVLGFTHYQPAQPVTLGKRATLWMWDFLEDLEEIQLRKNQLKMRGVKGTTGTQASFLELFDGDGEKVKALDRYVCEAMGFKESYPVTGQTYSRKVDAQILAALAGIGAGAHKMTNDLRLMQHQKEVEEPFEPGQIGSSAMAYKRNPMRCERIASLSKYLMALSANPLMVHATQWMERTLDDSANKRLAVAEAFLTADAILEIAINVTTGLVVYPKTIAAHLEAELPFMATETILMEEVKRGGDRQELHEKIRVHSQRAAREVKAEGKKNDLLDRLKGDPAFTLTEEEWEDLLDPRKFIGRAPEQTEEFIKDYIDPLLQGKNLEYQGDLRV